MLPIPRWHLRRDHGRADRFGVLLRIFRRPQRGRGLEGFDREDAEFLQGAGDAVERDAALAQPARDPSRDR